jgi:uncharacterized protein (DUF1800 family)
MMSYLSHPIRSIVIFGVSGIGLGSLILLSGTAIAADRSADPKVLHVINRLSLGPTPGEIDRVSKIGVSAYIQEQLSPETLTDPTSLTQQLRQWTTLSKSPAELLRDYNTTQAKQQAKPVETAQMPSQPARLIQQEATQARLARAIASPRQLEEVMVDFWYNHFNVYAGKGIDRVLIGHYEQTAIRPNALGKFRTLLGATAKHPAMLFYLDNWQNTTPNASKGKGKFNGINENYARELMELHTLGVNGGYSQKDVTTLAEILTGWSFKRSGIAEDDKSGFQFIADRHDSRSKVFLNQPIPIGGMEQGDRALDLLAKNPATAKYISYKLAQYFVADQPPQSLVQRLSQTFTQTDGNIRSVLQTLFQSPEFWDPKIYRTKFKTPYQYVISSARAIGSDTTNVRLLSTTLNQLGMPLYNCPTPNGYSNTKEPWLNPEAMNRRLSFVTVLTTPTGKSNSNLATTQEVLQSTELSTTLGNPFSTQTRSAIDQAPPALKSALMLGSPEFMYR